MPGSGVLVPPDVLRVTGRSVESTRRLPDMPRPPLFPPMLLSPGTLPTGTGWVFEPKFDRFRAIAYIDDSGVRLRSRSGNDLTRLAPEFR